MPAVTARPNWLLDARPAYRSGEHTEATWPLAYGWPRWCLLWSPSRSCRRGVGYRADVLPDDLDRPARAARLLRQTSSATCTAVAGLLHPHEAGDLMSRLTNDIDTIQQALSFALVNGLGGALLIVWIASTCCR